MAIDIDFENLENGQEVILPFEVHVQIISGNVSSAWWQIDDGEQKEILSLSNPLTFTIQPADCPTIGRFYMVTCDAVDTAGEPDTASRTIRMVNEPTREGENGHGETK